MIDEKSMSLNEYLNTCIINTECCVNIDYNNRLANGNTILKLLYKDIFKIQLLFNYFHCILDKYIITDYFPQSLCYIEKLNEEIFQYNKNDLIDYLYTHITDYINTLINIHGINNIHIIHQRIVTYFINFDELHIYFSNYNISRLYVDSDIEEYTYDSYDDNLRKALKELSISSFNKISEIMRNCIFILLLFIYKNIPIDIINIILLHYIQQNNININNLYNLSVYTSISDNLLELLYL